MAGTVVLMLALLLRPHLCLLPGDGKLNTMLLPEGALGEGMDRPKVLPEGSSVHPSRLTSSLAPWGAFLLLWWSHPPLPRLSRPHGRYYCPSYRPLGGALRGLSWDGLACFVSDGKQTSLVTFLTSRETKHGFLSAMEGQPKHWPVHPPQPGAGAHLPQQHSLRGLHPPQPMSFLCGVPSSTPPFSQAGALQAWNLASPYTSITPGPRCCKN